MWVASYILSGLSGEGNKKKFHKNVHFCAIWNTSVTKMNEIECSKKSKSFPFIAVLIQCPAHLYTRWKHSTLNGINMIQGIKFTNSQNKFIFVKQFLNVFLWPSSFSLAAKFMATFRHVFMPVNVWKNSLCWMIFLVRL